VHPSPPRGDAPGWAIVASMIVVVFRPQCCPKDFLINCVSVYVAYVRWYKVSNYFVI